MGRTTTLATRPARGAWRPDAHSEIPSPPMLSVSIGPLALPVSPLLLLAAVWTAGALSTHLARRAGKRAVATEATDALPQRANLAVFHAALAGLLAARLAHVALHAQAYLPEPWLVLDVRDGGWHAAAGLATAAAWLAWQAWRAPREPRLARALAVGALAGAAVWTLGGWATGRFEPVPRPTLAFQALEDGGSTSLAQVAAGRPQVVNLWASWCGPCRQEMPVLAQAQARQPHVAFVFVNQGESAEVARRYLAAEGLGLRHVLLDPRSTLGAAVRSRGLPTTLFYDAQGRQVDAHFGVLNAAALAAKTAGWRHLALPTAASPDASSPPPFAAVPTAPAPTSSAPALVLTPPPVPPRQTP